MIDDEQIGVIIENIDDIATADKAYIFDKDGGFIGSDAQCSFCVKDKVNKIQDRHIKIGFEEGFFTIAPIDNAEVFYNDSFSKMQSGFATIINKGDTFKISNITFRFVDSKDIEAEKIHKDKIDDIKKCDETSNMTFQPRGKVEYHFSEKEHIKNIIESKADYDFIAKQNKENAFETQCSYQNILNIIDNISKDLAKDKKRIELEQLESQNINTQTLEDIISSICLVKSPKIINLMALNLIIKELKSPIFGIMDNDIFMDCLKTALQNSIKENRDLFETLAITALESYKNK